MTASRGIGRGGARRGAGRRKGGRNRATLTLRAEITKQREVTGVDMRPSAFLTRIMLDESAPLAARIMCAGKVIPFVERKPEPTPPGEIPLMREWTNEQLESWEQRTRQDMIRDPGYYGREALEQMGLDWPLPALKSQPDPPAA